MESVAFIQWCLDHLNYWTITLLMAIESSFIPFPSEVVVPPAAYKAAVNEELNIYLVVLFATIGANIGAIINYYLARWLGRPIVYKFANSRFGHMCLIDEAKVQHAEEYFDKHGALSTFIPSDPCSPPTDFHPCRTCPHEIAHLPYLHHLRRRIMEHHPCRHRILSVHRPRH